MFKFAVNYNKCHMSCIFDVENESAISNGKNNKFILDHEMHVTDIFYQKMKRSKFWLLCFARVYLCRQNFLAYTFSQFFF